MDQIGKIIGKRKYEALKEFDLGNMTDESLEIFQRQFNGLTVGEALKMISAYEEKFTFNTREQLIKTAEYFDRINAPSEPKEKKFLTKEILWDIFRRKYLEQNGVNYSKEKDSLENLKPLVFYFIGDFEEFVKCAHLSHISKPSFDKGLLIIGGYGNGKSSVMKALEASLMYSNVSFRTKSANDVVTEFEGCNNDFDKREFWKSMTTGTLNFDDLLTEREASNYGKVNIFKDILEKRYDHNKRTYVTCNFDDRYPGDIGKGLEQFGEKYGSRVYDRLFSMFNVIEFKGKTHRI